MRFNFFVTVYHIRDYAREVGMDVSALDHDADFQLCRLACNTGKHLNLDGRSVRVAARRSFDTHGDVAYAGHEEYAVLADGDRIPVLVLGNRVLSGLQAWLGIP